jgi:phosphatidylinositol alpha-1,6-mannosyltransferase
MSDALLVSSSFLPGRGGIESYLAELCMELSPRLTVFAPARRDGQPISEGLPYPTHGYEGSLLVPTRRVARSIVDAARMADTDRILFGTPWPLILLGPRLRRAGLHYASIVHGAEVLLPGAIPGVRGRLVAALGAADLLLPVSAFTRARLLQLSANTPPSPPTEILRARVDIHQFNPEVDSTAVKDRFGIADAPVVLALGRLVRRKGVHRLIRALPRLAVRCPNVRVVVAGTGPEERSLRRLAAPFGERVIFTGRVPDEDAASLYAAANVLAIPVADRWWGLDTEGLGIVLLEASATGIPCVTGRSGGTPEAVVNGVTGHVVDATNQDNLVDAITGLLEDPGRAKRMGAAGRAHVVAEFAERRLPGALLEWLAGA